MCVCVMYETTTSALAFKWVSKKRVLGGCLFIDLLYWCWWLFFSLPYAQVFAAVLSYRKQTFDATMISA
jgi:hypothetical protein